MTQKERIAFIDIYKFTDKALAKPLDAHYWDELTKEAGALVKWHNNALCTALMIAVLDYLGEVKK